MRGFRASVLLESGLGGYSKLVPYTLLLRIEAMRFPTVGLLLYGVCVLHYGFRMSGFRFDLTCCNRPLLLLLLLWILLRLLLPLGLLDDDDHDDDD